MPSDFFMPSVSIGEIVLWHHAADKNVVPRPAIVTYVGADTISCSIIERDSNTLMCADGVRHVDDPTILVPEARESGSWSHVKASKQSAQQTTKGAQLTAAK